MASKRILILDVRQQHELATRHYSTEKLNHEGAKTNTRYDVLNIPAENIKYNLRILRDLFKQYDSVWITCYLNNRASYIKNTYFSDIPHVITNPVGHFGFKDFDMQGIVTKYGVVGPLGTSAPIYILQILFGVMQLVIAFALYMFMGKAKHITWLMYILIAVGLWVILEGLFKFCPGIKFLNRLYW